MSGKSSFLFVTWEGGGNVPPVLGLAHRLIQAGHTVRVLAEPCMRKQIEGIGAEYIGFKKHFTRTDRSIDLIQDWKAKPLSVPSIDNILINPALDVADETRLALTSQHTDVLVADFMMPGALIAAESLGVKRVALFHMPEYFPGPNRPPGGLGVLPATGPLGRLRDAALAKIFHKVLSQYTPRLNQVRQQFSLPGYDNILEIYHQADLRLIQTSRAFDIPIEPPPANVRYVGPVLDDPAWVEPMDLSFLEQAKRPSVLVSLSSTFQNQQQLLQRIIDALGALDVNGVVTLGPAMAKARFSAGNNVMLLKSAPHSALLPKVDAVITHAGHGTVMRALSYGKPLLCLPMGRDQLDNAALVAHHGAGIALKKNATSKSIRHASQKLLAQTHYRQGAETIALDIQRDAKENRAVRYLEALGNAQA